MVRYEFNQKKAATLRLFRQVYPGFLRPEACAWQIGRLPARAFYSYCKRLHDWGLLERKESPVRYRLSSRGFQRLKWLNGAGE